MPINAKNILIFGASGAIGNAFVKLFKTLYPNANIYPFSQNSREFPVDYNSEDSIAKAANITSQTGKIDIIIVATGILHTDSIKPEKSLKDISADNLAHIFQANSIIPALIAKHCLPKLNKQQSSLFAVLSARIGSISDNRLGGWYAYRASKAALNMLIKTAAIETARSNKQAIVVGLHPGTVDSDLSLPFQKNVPQGKLFTPDYSAKKLWQVMNALTAQDSGKCFAWDGAEVLP
ncbi:SDR family NAD(P)-dependent oxidoreductase (plasmid) [Catenovulum sp. SX2]|uniref:SDR family NAD(P)-dependent oxidoreductase n=1 Tax=Catenovulum sp. SX2 TaxID=3398614 RepID=UPI003F868230